MVATALATSAIPSMATTTALATASAAASAAAIGTSGKPASIHLLKGSASAALPAQQRARNVTISGPTNMLKLPVLVAVVNAFWTFAAKSHSYRRTCKRMSRHAMNKNVTEIMQQRNHLENAWRLPAVEKHHAPISNADTKQPLFIEQPMHWSKFLAAVLLLTVCSYALLNTCMGCAHDDHNSHTLLQTLTSIIILRRLMRLRL
mmetsp:Transcript_49865/g.96289  ORF Transcript_49865/g.96289 Transcript_49865/m.96289 type:complete len:204 (-) Transcript_49865:226-837(-)